jgi:hypothetical protein
MWAATIIQTFAALVFLGSVWWDARSRRQAHREAIVEKLHRRWMLAPEPEATDTERAGYPISDRQVGKYNQWLAEAGEHWRVHRP